KDEALHDAFPGYVFVGVLYRQYPVARLAPPPLKSSNVFAVARGGKAQLLNDPKGLEKFFREHAMGGSADRAKDGVRAWLLLSSQLKQDGFFKFKLMDDDTKAEKDKGFVASGKIVVMQGGSGYLGAKVTFDADGKFARVAEEAKIRPGPRPICQA